MEWHRKCIKVCNDFDQRRMEELCFHLGGLGTVQKELFRARWLMEWAVNASMSCTL